MQAEIFGPTLFDENFCFAPMCLHAVFNELKLNRFLCVVCNLRLASLVIAQRFVDFETIVLF